MVIKSKISLEMSIVVFEVPTHGEGEEGACILLSKTSSKRIN